MGVLDDAIRQHIELKRQHGASPEELEREKQEALGPARREASAEPGQEPETAEPAAPPVGHDAAQPRVVEDDTFGDAPPRGFIAPEDEPFADAPLPASDDDAQPSEEAEEDVLEETPAFLQETPEHDRLWFEQKPPRDFDFD